MAGSTAITWRTKGRTPGRRWSAVTLAVRGAFWKTLVFLGVIGAVNWAGYSLWVVGVFAAFPVTLMATTYIHLELKEQSDRDPQGVGR